MSLSGKPKAGTGGKRRRGVLAELQALLLKVVREQGVLHGRLDQLAGRLADLEKPDQPPVDTAPAVPASTESVPVEDKPAEPFSWLHLDRRHCHGGLLSYGPPSPWDADDGG